MLWARGRPLAHRAEVAAWLDRARTDRIERFPRVLKPWRDRLSALSPAAILVPWVYRRYSCTGRDAAMKKKMLVGVSALITPGVPTFGSPCS